MKNPTGLRGVETGNQIENRVNSRRRSERPFTLDAIFQRAARDELGLVRTTEVVFQFSE